MFTLSFFKTIRTAKFQLTCLLLATIYLIGLLWFEHRQNNFAEQIFPISIVKDDVKQLASNVSTGLRINNFPSFSFEQNQFVMDAFVWFRFPVGSESIETIKNFDFQYGEIKYKSDPMIKLIEKDVVVTYQVKVDFKAYLEYKDFPIGDHRLNIIMDNRSVTPSELCFNCDVSNFILSENLLIPMWKATRKIVQTGYIKSELDKNDPKMDISYPCIVFTIDFENQSLHNIVTLYFPMYVIFFICLFSLMMEMGEYVARMSLVATSVPILVLFRTVIVQLAPPPAGMTKVDFVYFLLVFLSLLILIFQAYLAIVMRKIKQYNDELQEKRIKKLEKANDIILILVIILLMLTVTYNSLFL